MAQNLIYFVQWEQQPKQLAMPADMAQLLTVLSGQPAQTLPPTLQTPPLQQVPPPTAQQQLDTAPPQPTGEPKVAEGMETDAQETEVGQSDKKMDDGAGAHELGSKELTGDTEQT